MLLAAVLSKPVALAWGRMGRWGRRWVRGVGKEVLGDPE